MLSCNLRQFWGAKTQAETTALTNKKAEDCTPKKIFFFEHRNFIRKRLLICLVAFASWVRKNPANLPEQSWHERSMSSYDSSDETCSKIFSQNFWLPLFCGSEKKAHKTPTNFPDRFPCQHKTRETHRRVCSVARGAWRSMLVIQSTQKLPPNEGQQPQLNVPKTLRFYKRENAAFLFHAPKFLIPLFFSDFDRR